MTKRILARFLRAKRPIFEIQKNHSLRQQPTYKCDLHAKFEVSTLSGLAYSVRTNMKKRILACFLRAKRPIFILQKKKPSLRHQPTYKCYLHAKFEVSTLNGLAYSVRTNMKKRYLAGFLRAKRPIFEIQKNHSLRQQPTYKYDLHAKFEVSTLSALA